MKIAGRKNDGAWYRTNLAISKLTEEEAGQLATVLNTDIEDEGNAFIEAMLDLKSSLGLPDELIAVSYEIYADVLAHVGVPRQVWFGVMSWDTYSKVGDRYVPDHAPIIAAFSKKLRKVLTRWLFARRELADLGNVRGRGEGNPGGIANAADDVSSLTTATKKNLNVGGAKVRQPKLQ